MATLYKKGKKGQVLIWKAHIVFNEYIHIEHGQQGCKMTEEDIHVDPMGSNTIERQLEIRLNRRIQNKLNCGYVHNIKDIDSSGKNQLGMERPMKAVLLRDGSTPAISYNAYAHAQRKYNGHRCIVACSDATGGCPIAYSSGGKAITSISHILADINIKHGQKLDGELYVHGLSLQKISSKVRTQNKTDYDLKFICFDQISEKPFIKRFNEIPEQSSEYIIMAETIRVHDFDDVKKLFHKFKSEKYEGAMLRHGKLGYEEGIRSSSIYKIKKLEGVGYYDEEFEVVRVLRSAEGWARLVCITSEGKRFRVSAPGTHYEKMEVLHDKDNYIGRSVMVEFPEWTDRGIPSQPVAIMWRDKHGE